MEDKINLAKLGVMQKRFNTEFNKYWMDFIKKCDKNMSRAIQLNIGNHTRPLLVYLGATANSDFNNTAVITETAQLAVSIEAIHKSSVIIDDIIDGDSMRRGQKCMHKEFGQYETIFFAVCMLALGIENINIMLASKNLDGIHATVISLLCNTIYEMCHGAIMEITSNVEKQTSLEYIQEIINSETIKLIENSLYIGFLYTGSENKKASDIIKNMGRKCGYIFQVMNDLEAFCNPQHIIEYKGNLNSDFLRSRKNIILPYLYNSCNKTDKKLLLSLLNGNELCFSNAQKLFIKYDIKDIILKDIDDIYISLFSEITSLSPEICNSHWIDIFNTYLNYSKTKYQSILNSL